MKGVGKTENGVPKKDAGVTTAANGVKETDFQTKKVMEVTAPGANRPAREGKCRNWQAFTRVAPKAFGATAGLMDLNPVGIRGQSASPGGAA